MRSQRFLVIWDMEHNLPSSITRSGFQLWDRNTNWATKPSTYNLCCLQVVSGISGAELMEGANQWLVQPEAHTKRVCQFLTLLGWTVTTGRTAQRLRIGSNTTGKTRKNSIKKLLMIFCYTYRSVSSPIVIREVISKWLPSDTETHSQKLCRVTGTSQKMGRKNCGNKSGSKTLVEHNQKNQLSRAYRSQISKK